MTINLKYRPDIDGLRAISIILVVAFHAFPDNVPGGFIGVDVFFVISGYLITLIILNQINEGSFSFLKFFAHRVRRIFPALIFLFITLIVVGWYCLLDDELRMLGKHIAAGAGFISNFIYWNEAGYFDSEANNKPLLQLWSLGIEMQFYIFWPFLLLIFCKWRVRLSHIFIAIGIISFSYNMYQRYHDTSGDFFSPHTRLWELVIGAFIASLLYETGTLSNLFKKFQSQKLLINTSSILGLGFIVFGVYWCSSMKQYPGYLALLPTLGSALIIISGSNSCLNSKVLASRGLVIIGLISYPLYLWHWSLLSLARIINSQEVSVTMRMTIVFLSLLLSIFTYLLIEKPFRNGRDNHFKTYALLFLMIACGLTGFYFSKLETFNSRVASAPTINYPGDIGHTEIYQYMNKHFYPCEPEVLRPKTIEGEPLRCYQSKKGPADIAIIGDSHAEHLFIGLAEELSNKNVVYFLRNGIPVVSNADFSDIFNHINVEPSIRKVILTFCFYCRDRQDLSNKLVETAQMLVTSGKQVYLTDDVPYFTFDPKFCKFQRPLSSERNCSEKRLYFDRQYLLYKPILNEVMKIDPRINVIETSKFFCDESKCKMEMDGLLLYRDKNHLNINGSKYVGHLINLNAPSLGRD